MFVVLLNECLRYFCRQPKSAGVYLLASGAGEIEPHTTSMSRDYIMFTVDFKQII